jgi:tRNA-guanine family transglycosylase
VTADAPTSSAPPTLAVFGDKLHRLPMMWVGQSVDTSILHTSVREYRDLPILTSLGCAIRRPSLLENRFGPHLKATLQARGPLMLDSGGFTMMRRKSRNWGVEDVSAVYDRVDADIVVSLDIPPSLTDSPRARASKLKRTLDNLAFLAPRFGARLMPVVHGRTQKEITASCKGILSLTPRPAWIGIGGLVPLLQRSGFYRTASRETPQTQIAGAVELARAFFPGSILHAFGVGSIQTMLALFALGVQSADSIGWRQAAGFGSIYLPGRNQRLLSWKGESPRPRPIINEADRALLAECSCPECAPIERLQHRVRNLAAGFKQRSLHNLWVLRGEIDALVGARNSFREMEFLSERLSDPWMSVISDQPHTTSSGFVWR